MSVSRRAAVLVLSAKQDSRVAEEKKSSGSTGGLISFAPWIVFGVASGFNHWRVAAGGGLILGLLSLAVMRSRGSSIKLMDWTMLAFFVIASVLTIGLRSASFPVYNAVIVWSCFAVACWSSVAIGRPFTQAYARENAPPEFWGNPVFIRLNRLMTLVWCGLMTVNVGVAAIGVVIGGLVGHLAFGFGLPMAVLLCGFAFNNRFPVRYLAQNGFEGIPASAPASGA
jgi:intracellular septation protein A